MTDEFDTDVVFEEEGHKYTIFVLRNNKRMYKITKDSIVSISVIGEYLYEKFGGAQKSIRVIRTYQCLHRYYREFQEKGPAYWASQKPPGLELRRPEVIRHFTQQSPHVPFLSYIIRHQKNCQYSYDELLLFLVENKKIAFVGGQYMFQKHPSPAHQQFISEFWELQATDGTAMHKQIESYFKGEDPSELTNYDFLKWKLWWDQSDVKKQWDWVESELIVHDPVLMITGQIDGVFRSKKDPTHYLIIDWKRTKEITVAKNSVTTGIYSKGNIVQIVPKDDTTHIIGPRNLDKYFVQVAMYRYLFLYDFPRGIKLKKRNKFEMYPPSRVDLAVLNVEPRGAVGVNLFHPSDDDNLHMKVAAILAKRKEELY
jgi:hypothetical protein